MISALSARGPLTSRRRQALRVKYLGLLIAMRQPTHDVSCRDTCTCDESGQRPKSVGGNCTYEVQPRHAGLERGIKQWQSTHTAHLLAHDRVKKCEPFDVWPV